MTIDLHIILNRGWRSRQSRINDEWQHRRDEQLLFHASHHAQSPSGEPLLRDSFTRGGTSDGGCQDEICSQPQSGQNNPPP
eukprot:1973240-Amphidinium_carterae.4